MSVEQDIYAAVHKALDENDNKVKELAIAVAERDSKLALLERENLELATKWDTERAKILKESQEVVDALESDIVQVKRKHDAYVEKSDKEIIELTLGMESSIKESGAELDHWKRENERLGSAILKNSLAFSEELKEKNSALEILTASCVNLAHKHEELIDEMNGRHEGIVSHQASELATLRADLKSLHDSYQEERAIVKKAWKALGYDPDNGSLPKPIEELIRDKNVEIAAQQKARETLAYSHADQVTALTAELEAIRVRQKAMEDTISRYKGIQDQSDLIVRMADAMEREQWSGSGEGIPQLIEEARKQVVATR